MRPAALLLLLLNAAPAASQTTAPDAPRGDDTWFSTFSIVAFDPGTLDLGVAVASRPVGAGAAVPWAEAGVGAVATQAGANRTYGPKAMALLRQGLSAPEVVKRITDEDPNRERYQVAVIDMQGRTGVFTSNTVLTRGGGASWAGSIEGDNYSVQGNTLASEKVLEAMAAAYEDGVLAGKPLEERLMDALDAGNAEGGDVRGMGSAGILVVRPVPEDSPSIGRRVDLRVDHHLEDPFAELRRILGMGLANQYAARSAELAGAGRLAEALEQQRTAAEMNPLSAPIRYGLAERYAQAGEYLNALLALREAVRMQGTLRGDAAENPAFQPMREMVEFRRLVEGG